MDKNTVGQATEERAMQQRLQICAGIIEQIGIKQVRGCLFQFGGISIYALEVISRMDYENHKQYDGWFYFMPHPDHVGPCCLAVRWLGTQYQYVWEPAVLLFNGNESITEWDGCPSGEVSL